MTEPEPQPSRSRLVAAGLAIGPAALAVVLGLLVLRVHHPPGLFLKYPWAAAATPDQLAPRLLDLSPLYLAFVGRLLPAGPHTILVVQCFLLAAAAAAVALAVARLSGPWSGLAAGAAVAAYRPFLVHAGVHEPEALVVTALALASALGIVARLGGRAAPATALGAGLALGAAVLLRPTHLLLVPVWGWWLASPRPPGARGRRRLGLLAMAAAVLVVAPVLGQRWARSGMPLLMNPGPVFYEGNGPAATGLRRHAPEAVLALEQSHREQVDYAHVAYRRVAAAALGGDASVAESNRYFARLAGAAFTTSPAASARRLAAKLSLALQPYEANDLVVTEDLDRRARARWPPGFALALVTLPWLLLARPERLRALAGPLAVAGLALLVQVVFYASARQRLPLALGLLVAGAALLPDLLRGELRRPLRPALLIALGAALALLAGFGNGGVAAADQTEWDLRLGSRSRSLGERLVRLQDGRALRGEVEAEAQELTRAMQELAAGDPQAARRRLAPLAAAGVDLTVDEHRLGVAAYWLARAHLAAGDRPAATRAATAARALRPGEPRIAFLALALTLGRAPDPLPAPPPGVDPVSARLAAASAARLIGDEAAAMRLVAPLAGAFPELAGALPAAARP